MKPVVLVGHRHSCPLHGPGTVTTGAAEASINGRAIARVTDRISCGATIITGALNCEIEGHPVARQGDHTDHGGVLEDGDSNWMVE
ncbi:PAAR domain-containing protein [Paraburkholderia tropica]|uniref:Zn-binding protein involved in type VI secretion n=2 Tax=Paraburkholderia tropica TaxID=92647 RepID=A0ABX5MWH6_9BURK|nr:PAAR domain-containing protein [Paraburkholderia tropica]MDE1139184.1 PAAR domain-containing protein [Paraburkholderia tropica]PXX19630.1 putative Zn-binding protein involved in type VI secretion [Paraburkholderia tropica]PZW88571.1 putative Zn-binding protein involved in type VI secretion [Paraburkholderia tropica]